MSTIQLMADSTCDLTSALLDAHGIRIIPLHVVFPDRTYKDRVDLDTAGLYAQVETRKMLPRTSAPSPAEFMEAFEPIIRSGGSIVYISLSSNLSSTYQNAVVASREFPEGTVEVVDSRNLSTGIGLLLLKASDYIREGVRDASELAGKLRRDTVRVETEFAIDTLDYLHKGGRCSGTQLIIGSLLRIHPVIKVMDGGMIVAEKLRGRMDKVAQGLLDRVKMQINQIDRTRVFVTHSMAEETALWLKDRLQQELGLPEVLLTDAGCVISSHCGPGTIGILFMKLH